MFGQMPSRNRAMLPPCPCNNTCRCHLPQKGMSSNDKRALIAFIFVFFLFEGILIWYGYKHPHTGPDHIEVNGKMCEIGYHRDCALPLSCGHKIAICKE